MKKTENSSSVNTDFKDYIVYSYATKNDVIKDNYEIEIEDVDLEITEQEIIRLYQQRRERGYIFAFKIYDKATRNKIYESQSYQKTLDEYEDELYSKGGGVMSDGKFKLRGFPPIDKVELMGLYDDFKENFSSKIERFTKHLNKVHNSKLRLIDIKELMDYAKMNFVSKGGIVEYHDYKGVEIMYEPTYEEYFVNDLVFNSLEKAHKYIDSGEANETPTYIQNLYRRGAMAKGGSVVSKENSIKEFFKKFGFNVEDIQKDEYSNGIEGWIVFYDNKNKYRVIDYSVAMYLIVHDKTTNKTDIIKQSKSFNIDNFAKGGGVSSWNTLTIEKIGKNFPYKLNALNEILQNAGGKRNGKIYDFSLDRQSNKYDTFAQFVYSASIILNDTGSDSVTPSGTYFSQKSLPIRFYLRLTIRKDGNNNPITINASKDVAGGMSIYKSMEVNSLYDIEKYINSIIRDNPPNNLENMVYKDGGSVKNGYMVFNYTDNLYATNEVFQTKNDAKRFIDEFKKRFVLQGYYRDSNMNKIDINDVDLYVLDADFNPYKFSEGGIVTYANLDLNTNRNIIAKAIEFISGTGVDAESMTLEGKEIRFKYRTSNTYTTISQKLISDTISTNRKILELRGKNFATGGRVKVGVFNDNQLRNKEDEKAVEKAQKETGLIYVDTKIIKKGGQMFLEVYLISNEEYYNSKKFNKGGGIADDNKNNIWYEVLQKFFKIFYGEYEDDTAEKYIKDSQVTTDQAKYYYENFMDKYKTERTLSDGFKIFKQSLTKEELDSIQISFNSEDYADAEEHDTQKRYSTITIKKKENFKKGGSVIDEQVYIDYMNKEKGFKRDRIYFNSYAEAVEWGRKNFEKFNTDMINYV